MDDIKNFCRPNPHQGRRGHRGDQILAPELGVDLGVFFVLSHSVVYELRGCCVVFNNNPVGELDPVQWGISSTRWSGRATSFTRKHHIPPPDGPNRGIW